MLKQNFFKTLVVIILIGGLYPSFASAIGFGGISARPAYYDPEDNRTKSWFIYNLGPGESKEDAVIVINTTEFSQTVKIYAVDSLASNTGAFALKKENAEKDFVGVWVELETDEVIVPAKSEQMVNFTITIPEEVDVGEHSGGIIVQTVEPDTELEQTGAVIKTRIGVRIYETVPGEVIKKVVLNDLAVKDLKEKNIYLVVLHAQNQGTITITGKAILNISGWGLNSFTEIFRGFEANKNWQIMRGKEAETPWDWPKPKFGRFILKAGFDYEGSDGPEVLETAPLIFWVIPKKETGILIAIILLLIANFVIQKVRNSGRGWNLYKVKKGDDIVALGEKYGISWKRMAKVNKVKKPFLLRPGESILVPDKGKPAPKQGKTGQEVESNIKATHKKLKITIILVIVLVVALGGLIVYRKFIIGQEPGQEAAPLIDVSKPPIPALPTKSEVKISIFDFNTEYSSFVSELKTKLETMGYPEINVATTTTEALSKLLEDSTETVTLILYQQDVMKKLQLLEKDLLKGGIKVKAMPQEELETDIIIAKFQLADLNSDLGIIDESKVAIQVLNGGAETGMAGELSEKIGEQGYNMLKPANADNFDYQGLTIYYQVDFENVANILEELLKEEYEPISLEEKQEIETNIEIIIGESGRDAGESGRDAIPQE